MSREIIEAVFRYSHQYDKQLMLICSRNQIDVGTGYVFTTRRYMNYIAEMRSKYPQSNIIICRDHCGTGFGSPSDTFESVRNTIRCDLENGFDLIHIDLCKALLSHAEKLEHTTNLMRYALDIKPDVMFEIGTDENTGVVETDVDRIIADIRICKQVADPIFFVVQTGSLVREIHNIGSFNSDMVEKMHEALGGLGVKLKEHNADYLTSEQIIARRGIVDAVNIAPQLGVIQTNYVLSQALIYGTDTLPFMTEVVKGGNWRKWVDYHRFDDYPSGVQGIDPRTCLIIAGHYHFNGLAYQEFVNNVSGHLDVKNGIIGEVIEVIDYYLSALGEESWA